MTVQEWRDRHRRCKWCKYLHVYCNSLLRVGPSYRCRAKQRYVNPDLPRPFCRLFEQKIEHVLTDETEADIVSKFSPAGRELYYKIVYPERED